MGRRKNKLKKRMLGLKKTARHLENKKFPSEMWFRRLWKTSGLNEVDDKYNYALYPYICDVVNLRYKMIIEIDGAGHFTHKGRTHDARRDAFFSDRGYRTFRIRAFSDAEYKDVMRQVEEYKKSSGLVSSKPPSTREKFVNALLEGGHAVPAEVAVTRTILRKAVDA